MATAEEVQKIYNYAQGTEAYHRLSLMPLKCTDSVKILAETAGAFWLVDAIGSYLRKEPFQVWTLCVTPEKTATLWMIEDSGEKPKVEQRFEHTDFPVGSWIIWVVDGVLMLPGDY